MLKPPGHALMIANVRFLPLIVSGLLLGACQTSPALDPVAEAELQADAAAAPVAPSGIIAGLAQPDTPSCPTTEIFEGGSSMRGRGSAASSTGVDFQVSLNDVARECRFEGGTMAMRVGVRGRVILGTAGRAGTYNVPLRIAVKRLGGDTVYSNLVRLSVNAGDGIGGAAFQHVEENISLPQGPDGIDVYEVLVGVDPSGNATAPRRKKR
jgi:hypothetical protein